MELATEENEQAVARAYEQAMSALHAGKATSPELRLIHDVEHMMQEANSGASFEQYFRWASTDELRNIMGHLRTLGLTDVAEITTDAMRVAFPNGTPSTQEAKDEATDWTPEQESELNRLFTKLEELNGRVMNILGAYARRVGA
jgi:hypothetical protein